MATHPRRGALHVVSPPAGVDATARICLILGSHSTPTVVEVALVHPYVELATHTDGIVAAGPRTRTRYSVVVQTDLRGVVWPTQVGRQVGRLAPTTLDTISTHVRAGGSGSDEHVWVGLQLMGPTDRRWAFKAQEGAALDALTGERTRTLLSRC